MFFFAEMVAKRVEGCTCGFKGTVFLYFWQQGEQCHNCSCNRELCFSHFDAFPLVWDISVQPKESHSRVKCILRILK